MCIPHNSLHRLSYSSIYHYSHFPNNAWSKTTKFLIPKLPNEIGLQISHFHHVKFLLLPHTSPKKTLFKFFHYVCHAIWQRKQR